MHVKFMLLACFILSIHSASSACSCMPLEKIKSEEIDQSQSIFIGEVLSIIEDEENYNKQTKFKVTTSFKGPQVGDTIMVNTALNSAACGLPFSKGENWYVFTYSYEGDLFAGLCGRSKNMAKWKIDRASMPLKQYCRQKRYQNKLYRNLKQEHRFIKRYMQHH